MGSPRARDEIHSQDVREELVESGA